MVKHYVTFSRTDADPKLAAFGMTCGCPHVLNAAGAYVGARATTPAPVFLEAAVAD
jgi:hypothetical protein